MITQQGIFAAGVRGYFVHQFSRYCSHRILPFWLPAEWSRLADDRREKQIVCHTWDQGATGFRISCGSWIFTGPLEKVSPDKLVELPPETYHRLPSIKTEMETLSNGRLYMQTPQGEFFLK